MALPLGLDSSLVGPRAIRYSRGLELLELHVPLNLVQKYLGQQKPSQIAAFLNFSGGEARRIVHSHVLSKTGARPTDDRNSFLGIVSRIDMGMRMACVEVTTFSDLRLTALCSLKRLVRLELRENQVVTILVDPDQIILAAEKNAVSVLNCVSGQVESLHQEKVESFVSVALPDGTKLNATLETAALEKLRLREGKKIYALFPARAVRLCLD